MLGLDNEEEEVMSDKTLKKEMSKRCAIYFEELVAGRPTALADIYDIAGRQMFVVAYNVLRDYQLAEDALQEGLLLIYKNASTLKDNKSALSWMLTIIRNAALDILRSRKNEVSMQDIILESDEACSRGSDSTYDMSTSVEIDEALERLDENDRQIVILKSVMGYSHKEISKVLGITLAACQKKYQRALKELSIYLQ